MGFFPHRDSKGCVIGRVFLLKMEQDTRFELAPSVWKTDVLAANTNPALLVGGVGVEPTHPLETDLQSAAPLRLRRPPIRCGLRHTFIYRVLIDYQKLP